MSVVGTVSGASSTSLQFDLDSLTTRVATLLRRSDINVEIQQWINFAQREATDDINFPELRRTVYTTLIADTYKYTIPTEFGKEDRVYYIDTTATPTWGRELVSLPRKLYETGGIERLLNISDPIDGDPLYYLIDYNDLILYPAPNKAARIELSYYKLPSDLTQGTNLSDIDNRWRHYLIWLAYFYGMTFLEKEDVNKIVVWQRKYDDTMKKLKRLVLRRENRILRFPQANTGLENAAEIY